MLAVLAACVQGASTWSALAMKVWCCFPLCSLLLSSPLVSALATGNRVQVPAHDTQWWRSVVVFARMPPAVEGT